MECEWNTQPKLIGLFCNTPFKSQGVVCDTPSNLMCVCVWIDLYFIPNLSNEMC